MEEKKSNGALIGLIIIIILLLAGGIYVWQKNKNKIIENTQSPAVTEEDATSLESLETDLNTLDTNIDVNIDNLE